jgi:hypothetical protein
MAESSIQNVTEPHLHKASLYSVQFAIFFFDLPITTPFFCYMESDRRIEERFNWFSQQRQYNEQTGHGKVPYLSLTP